MKAQIKFFLSSVFVILVLITSCVSYEEPMGIIALTVTFPDSDSYKTNVIPEGTTGFSIFIGDIDNPSVAPKTVSIEGNPGETKSVEIDIGVGNYRVAVLATGKDPFLQTVGVTSDGIIFAGGISDAVQVFENQFSEAVVVLQEVLWHTILFPEQVKKDTIYDFSAKVTRLADELTVSGSQIIWKAFDEYGEPISDSYYYKKIFSQSYEDDFISFSITERTPNIESTGTLKVRFSADNVVFGSYASQSLGMYVSPVFEIPLVEKSESGIIITIK